ncbi:hypothetical protein AVEN_233447-1 [Araneus ventricosus]|uniref:Uncharacterized protein n=1 Tax=Araneus ventricosus TaxID=182803 RepID=A0A4Y2QY82_ARAVE|nr:hypothetical protein AVEN_233447-1 [Araneus ventricosus]
MANPAMSFSLYINGKDNTPGRSSPDDTFCSRHRTVKCAALTIFHVHPKQTNLTLRHSFTSETRRPEAKEIKSRADYRQIPDGNTAELSSSRMVMALSNANLIYVGAARI